MPSCVPKRSLKRAEPVNVVLILGKQKKINPIKFNTKKLSWTLSVKLPEPTKGGSLTISLDCQCDQYEKWENTAKVLLELQRNEESLIELQNNFKFTPSTSLTVHLFHLEDELNDEDLRLNCKILTREPTDVEQIQFNDLPEAIIRKIFQYSELPATTLSAVCKSWNEIIEKFTIFPNCRYFTEIVYPEELLKVIKSSRRQFKRMEISIFGENQKLLNTIIQFAVERKCYNQLSHIKLEIGGWLNYKLNYILLILEAFNFVKNVFILQDRYSEIEKFSDAGVSVKLKHLKHLKLRMKSADIVMSLMAPNLKSLEFEKVLVGSPACDIGTPRFSWKPAEAKGKFQIALFNFCEHNPIPSELVAFLHSQIPDIQALQIFRTTIPEWLFKDLLKLGDQLTVIHTDLTVDNQIFKNCRAPQVKFLEISNFTVNSVTTRNLKVVFPNLTELVIKTSHAFDVDIGVYKQFSSIKKLKMIKIS